MTRKFALVAGVLFSSFSAGSLLAQTSAAPKPTPSGSMQHAPAAAPSQSAKQDTTKVRTTAMGHTAWTKEQVEEAQEGLAKGGYYKGKPTGVWNSDSRKALKAYQKANSMPQTGRLSDSVLVKLKSA